MTMKKLENRVVEQLGSWQILPDLKTAVKELIDNALDASATSLTIDFENYGLEGFEVADDGVGISPGDFDNIATKGATSKISTFEEIYDVKSLGFRGEALAALRTVGMLVISSRRENDSVGLEAHFDNTGKITKKEEKVRNQGTTIKVTELFRNVPVRYHEFKRTHKAQFKAAMDLIQAYALVAHSVKFSVSNLVPAKGRQNIFIKGVAASRDQNIELPYGSVSSFLLKYF